MFRFINIIRLVFLSFLEWLIGDIPGLLGRKIRYLYYKHQLKYLGKGVQFDVGVRILNPKYVSIDDNTWIDNYVVIIAGPPIEGKGPFLYKNNTEYDLAVGEVSIGRNVHIANFVVIQGHGGVKIGSNLCVASGSKIYSLSHHHSNLKDRTDTNKYKFTSMVSRSEQSLICSPVVLQDDTAVGLNSVLLPGVTVGSGTWVASASVVTQNFPENVLVGGNPARVLKVDLHPGWKPTMANNG